MIEIDTIQDIRHIESKIIAGLTGKQLIALFVAGIIDLIVYLITHELFFVMIITGLILLIAFFKIDNLTFIEMIQLYWDKQNQAYVRNYKRKNTISNIEKQCRMYASKKNNKRRRTS